MLSRREALSGAGGLLATTLAGPSLAAVLPPSQARADAVEQLRDLYRRHPELAPAGASGPARASAGDYQALEHLQGFLKERIRYRPGLGRRWTVAIDEGNCADFAVRALWDLLDIGFPRGAMALRLCRTEAGEDHMVLRVADHVLDIRWDFPEPVEKLSDWGYTWTFEESLTQPGVWLPMFDGGRDAHSD